MSTYNGEKYIREQLDSILQQSLPVEILIRDDGSSDGTISIIEEYMSKGVSIELIKGENVGVIASFFELIKVAPESDYYAFSDQDDYWLEDKIKNAVEMLGTEDMPMLYCSDTYLVDGDLNVIKQEDRNPRPSFGNAIVENICTGCTAVGNRQFIEKIRENIPDTTKIIMHDWWLYLIAELYGKTVFDHNAQISYRQHGNNEWGAKTSKWKVYKYRFKQLFAKRGQIYRQLEELERCCGQDMKSEQVKLVKEVCKTENTLLTRMRLFGDKKIYRNDASRDLVYRLAMFLGKL